MVNAWFSRCSSASGATRKKSRRIMMSVLGHICFNSKARLALTKKWSQCMFVYRINRDSVSVLFIYLMLALCKARLILRRATQASNSFPFLFSYTRKHRYGRGAKKKPRRRLEFWIEERQPQTVRCRCPEK